MHPKYLAWTTLTTIAATLLTGCVGAPLTIIPDELTDGVVGQPYNQDLSSDAGGGESWDLAGGSLPPGLSLNRSTGVISGSPTGSGSYNFSVITQLAGLEVRTGQAAYSVTIYPQLTLDASLPIARVDEPYNTTPDAAGGVPPYTFTVVGLPAGLSYDRDTGQITGTPVNASQGLQVAVTVRDSGPFTQTASSTTTLVVKPQAVEFTVANLDDGQVNAAYSETLSVANGFGPYTWTITDGLLPDGLRLNRDSGVISGTPTTAGTSAFTVQVVDSDSPASSTQAEFTIVIND